MDFLQEAIASRDIIVWVVLVIILIIVVKLLKIAGKCFALLLIVLAILAFLATVFPDIFAPAVDFMRGGWLGDQRPEYPR